MRRKRAIWWAVLGLLVAGLAGVAFWWLWMTPDDIPTAGPTATPQPTPTAMPTPSAEPVQPLTGLPLGDARLLDQPAVAVKVSDVRSAHPQVGVDRADIVFCEPIGVSYTRLAAVFHSDVPDEVGPVRSARPMDAALLSPLNPVFAHTMAAQWVMTYLAATATAESLGSLQVPADSGAYVIDPARPAPDHVLVRPAALLALSQTASPAQPYFAYADADSEPSALAGRPATSVTVSYGPGWDVRWEFNASSGRYQRFEPWGAHVMADGTQVGATNVLVLQAESVLEKLSPGEGGAVPVLQLVDESGPLLAFTGGRTVRGTWSKGDVDEPFVLTTRTGDPLLLAPGNTWVELPAKDAAITYS